MKFYLVPVFCLIYSILYSTAWFVTNNNDLGPGSFRQAIIDAQDGDSISADNAYSIQLDFNAQITFSKSLFIVGDFTFVAGNFNISENSKVIFKDIAFQDLILENNAYSKFQNCSFQNHLQMINNDSLLLIQSHIFDSEHGLVNNSYLYIHQSKFSSICEGIDNNNTCIVFNSIFHHIGELLDSVYFYDCNATGGAFLNYGNLSITNSTFARCNSFEGRSPAINNYDSGSMILTNNIFFQNEGYEPYYFGDIYDQSFYNGGHAKIFGQNNILERFESSGLIECQNGNRSVNPEFIQVPEHGFQDTTKLELSNSSPAINQGTADTSGLSLPIGDFRNYHRIFGDTIDIGAYEIGSSPIQMTTSIEEESMKHSMDLKIIPNPSNGHFKLEFDPLNKKKIQVDILSIDGKVIQQKLYSINRGQNYLECKVKQELKGLFILRLSSRETKQSSKLLIQ